MGEVNRLSADDLGLPNDQGANNFAYETENNRTDTPRQASKWFFSGGAED
jgi:hypothetical protein